MAQWDVALSDMEDENHCMVSYKYDIDAEYTNLASFSGDHDIDPLTLVLSSILCPCCNMQMNLNMYSSTAPRASIL